MCNHRIIKALKIIREEAPEYFEARISGRDCPSDWDLPESCPHVSNNATAQNCRNCWENALGEEEKA